MNPDRILLRLGQRAAALTGSRAPAVANAARRARAAVGLVRRAVRIDLDAALLVQATLEAVIILQAVEHRESNRSARRRTRHLATVAHIPRKMISDAELLNALEAANGGVRKAARALGVAPSTVSRRLTVANRDATQHPTRPIPRDARRP